MNFNGSDLKELIKKELVLKQLERMGLKRIENFVIWKYRIGKDCIQLGLGRIEWEKEYVRFKIFVFPKIGLERIRFQRIG